MGVFRQNLKLEKSLTNKDDIVRMLKSSLDAVKSRFSELTAADLDRPVDFFGDRAACVSTHSGAQQRAHGTGGGVRADERHRASVVASAKRRTIGVDAPGRICFTES